MAKKKNAPMDARALRRQLLADQAERNAAAQAATDTQQQEHERFRALSPMDQKRELRAQHQANLAAQAERNAEAGPAGVTLPEPKLIAGRRMAPENKALSGPAQNKDGGDALEGVPFASAGARDAAAAAGMSAEHFKRRKRSSERGFTKADVERIAAATDEGDEE